LWSVCHALHRTNFRGTIEPKKIAKSTSKEHTKGNWYKRTSGFLGLNLFFWEKNLKRVLRSFPRDSSTWFVGVRWLLFCLYPNSGNVHSSYCRNFQIFPEVDLDYRHVNVEKFTGRALFQQKHTSNLKTSREVNFWIFFSNSVLTIMKPFETEQWRRWREGRMVVRNFRRQWCQELRR
jgi:hypothetical protein